MLEEERSLTGDISARIASSADLTFGNLENLLLNAYVPGVEPSTSPLKKPDISIRHQETVEDIGLTWEGFQFNLRDSWKDTISQDLYHLLYSATRVKMMEQGLYSVHSACVGKDSQILIVGHSGSGKTTTALELAKSYDWLVSSGNKTVIEFDTDGRMFVRAGTKTMTVRLEDAERFATPLGRNITDYGSRLAFDLAPERYLTNANQPLKAIVKVRFHDGLHDIRELTHTSALHTLYPFFMDKVNEDALVANGAAVYQGTPPRDASNYLRTKLKLAVTKIPIIEIAGSRDFVVGALADMYE